MSEDVRTVETRRRLIDAAMQTIRDQGIAKVSARTIAATGGVNQGLIFYHFGSVAKLIGEACLVSTSERLVQYDDRFDAVDSFAGLLRLASELHAEEHALGNVNVLAQVLAGSQSDPELAEVTGQALALWTDRVRTVLTRLLATSPVGEALDAQSLAGLVASMFIGIELTGVTSPGADAMAALEELAPLADLVDGLGPLASRAVRSALRKHT